MHIYIVVYLEKLFGNGLDFNDHCLVAVSDCKQPIHANGCLHDCVARVFKGVRYWKNIDIYFSKSIQDLNAHVQKS